MSGDETWQVQSGSGTTVGAESKVTVDSEILELLLVVLNDVGYETETVAADNVPLVLAENLDNVVAATAMTTVADLIRVEPMLSRLLVDRLGGARADGKRWDGYVILLTTQPANLEKSETLFGVTYNLRHVRRIVRIGIEPTVAGIARALRPVLPLVHSASADSAFDPLVTLAQRLMTDGVDPESVQRAVARFRSDHPSRDSHTSIGGSPEPDEDGFDE
jgi:hypothetical protein